MKVPAPAALEESTTCLRKPQENGMEPSSSWRCRRALASWVTPSWKWWGLIKGDEQSYWRHLPVASAEAARALGISPRPPGRGNHAWILAFLLRCLPLRIFPRYGFSGRPGLLSPLAPIYRFSWVIISWCQVLSINPCWKQRLKQSKLD